MKYVFLLLLTLFLCLDLSAQALDALPTIDQPQEFDKIHTYTRGFSAAFRLDTLRKYFSADIVEGVAVNPNVSIPDSLRGRYFISTLDSLYYVDYFGAFVNLTPGTGGGGGTTWNDLTGIPDSIVYSAELAAAQDTALNALADSLNNLAFRKYYTGATYKVGDLVKDSSGFVWEAMQETTLYPNLSLEDWILKQEEQGKTFFTTAVSGIARSYEDSYSQKILIIGDSNGERTGSWAQLLTLNAHTTQGAGGPGLIQPIKEQGLTHSPIWTFYNTQLSAGWSQFNRTNISAGVNSDNPFGRAIVSSITSDTIRYSPSLTNVGDIQLSNIARIVSKANGAAYQYRIDDGAWQSVTTTTGGGIHLEDVGLNGEIEGKYTFTIKPLTDTLHHYGVIAENTSFGKSSTTTYSLAMSGSNSKSIADLDRAQFIAGIQAIAPDIAIISHATNNQGVTTVEQYRANLDSIINRLRVAVPGINPLIMSQIPDVGDATQTDILEYGDAAMRLAKGKGCYFLNIARPITKSKTYDPSIFVDGVHYTNEVQRSVFGLVADLISQPIISPRVTTKWETFPLNSGNMIVTKSEKKVGVGTPRTGAALDPLSTGAQLQLIPSVGGIGLKIQGPNSQYGIQSIINNSTAGAYAGFFQNDTDGTSLYSQGRGTGVKAVATGSGTTYAFDGESNGNGIWLKSKITPIISETTTSTSAISLTMAATAAIDAAAAGAGTSILFRDRVGGTNGVGGTVANRIRVISELTSASTSRLGFAVKGTGVSDPLYTPQYTFGGGSSGIFSTPGLSVSTSANFGGVEVTNAGNATATTSLVTLGQLSDSLTTVSGGAAQTVYETILANVSTTGGGIVTVTNLGVNEAAIKWSERILVLPAEEGGDIGNTTGLFLINPVTIGDVIDYYPSNAALTTTTVTANGISLPTFSGLFAKIVPGSNTIPASNLAVVAYDNTAFALDEKWILIANFARTTEVGVKYLPANILFPISGGTYNVLTDTKSWGPNVVYTSGTQTGRVPSITADGQLKQTGLNYASAGNYNFLNSTGSKLTSLKSLELGQTGDQYGGVSLLLRNRDAHNGMRIITDHPTINLVDLQFKTALTPFVSMRVEARSGSQILSDSQHEFQFFYAPIEGASSASLTRYLTFGPNRSKFHGVGGLRVPTGTTAQRWADQGAIRYNTTLSQFEGYDGSAWAGMSGTADNLGNHTATTDLLMGSNAITWTSDFTNIAGASGTARFGAFGAATTVYPTHIDLSPQASIPISGNNILFAREVLTDGVYTDDLYKTRLWVRSNKDSIVQTTIDANKQLLTVEDVPLTFIKTKATEQVKTSGSTTDFAARLPRGSYEVTYHFRYKTNTAGGGILWFVNTNANIDASEGGFARTDQFATETAWTTGADAATPSTVTNTYVGITYTGVMEIDADTTVTVSTGPNGTGNLTLGANSYVKYVRIKKP